MKLLRFILAILCLSGGFLFAGQHPKIAEDVLIEAMPPEEMMAPEPGLPHEFFFISAEMEPGKIVKGAPYRAEAVTERTQTLADGNRIVRKSTTKIYRDSEGRTRREQQFNSIGNWKAAEEPPSVIFIQDPVANVHYVLEPENHVARKIEQRDKVMARSPNPGVPAPPPPPAAGEKFEWETAPPAGGHFGGEVIRYKMTEKDAKTESLGKQTIEGLPVEGSRTTMTIPAGEMGNELPIQVVTEKWFSPDLQTNVMTRHSDPRFGETIYQLTHISRTEQDRSLFEVPDGYKIEKGPLPPHKVIRHEIKHD